MLTFYNVFVYDVDEYNHVGIARKIPKGGEVSLYISQEFVYSEFNDLCMATDYMKCLFVELRMKDSS